MENISATQQQPLSVATDRETDTTNQKQTKLFTPSVNPRKLIINPLTVSHLNPLENF